MELHSSEGKGDRGKRTSDCDRTLSNFFMGSAGKFWLVKSIFEQLSMQFMSASSVEPACKQNTQ